MNRTLNSILIVGAVLLLAAGLFFLGSMYGRFNTFGPGMFLSYSRNTNAYGSGMMGRSGGFGMMHGAGGYDMMNNRYGWNNGSTSAVIPLTTDQARQAAGKYIQSLNIQGLEAGEVMVFDNNAYVAVKESGTGLGAFELLVDPVSQVAYPEYGPNMMWNLKYGGINHGATMGAGGGMMGSWNKQSMIPANMSPEMPVTKDQAIQYAQAFLDKNQPGTVAANDPMQFYGYYTLDFSKDSKVAGMLSVNGYNGQIFLHTWHGTFIAEAR
jgi:hypothetical protein